MNKELEEAIKRIRILLQDRCECKECIKNKKAYEVLLNYIENSVPKEKVEEKIEELENEQSKVKNNKLIYSREDVFRFQIYILEEMLAEK